MYPAMRRARLPAAAALCGALLALYVASSYSQGAPALSFPVECELGQTCVVQNYFDHDPGRGTKDYRCGHLTYDGHDGTDIRLVNLAAMHAGFRVLAAADGKVRAIRDGMDDASFRLKGREAVRGREAGNGVAIEHGNGWNTQYSHMRRGSVLVKPGDAVKRGQPLGLIGLSGWTEFPHLHLTVRHHGRKIDPFAGSGEHRQCGLGANPLWDARTLAILRYVPSGMLDAGFSGEMPTFDQVKAGRPAKAVATAPVMVFWVTVYGLQAGDAEHIRILAPDGSLFSESSRKVEANRAQSFSYAGKKRRAASWPEGTYRGEYTLTRGGKDGPRRAISVVRELQVSR